MASEDVPESERLQVADEPAAAPDPGEPAEQSLDPEQVAETSEQASGEDAEARGAAPGRDGEPGAGEGAAGTADGAEETEQASAESPAAGLVLGALGLVSAGLGLVSLTGMTLSGMLRRRANIEAQIQSSLSGSGGNPIQAAYNTPWQDTAIVNGVTGIVAAALGAVVLIIAAPRIETRRWQQPVALAGVILGVIGIVIAIGMYTGAFAPAPRIPSAPAPGGG
jgi:multisubunit Na+/H+ antiporter MnhB subunit